VLTELLYNTKILTELCGALFHSCKSPPFQIKTLNSPNYFETSRFIDQALVRAQAMIFTDKIIASCAVFSHFDEKIF